MAKKKAAAKKTTKKATKKKAAKPFPAAFQQTEELGWIPEGWEERTVADFVHIKHGYAFKGEYFSDEETCEILVTPGNFRIGGGFKSSKLKFYRGPVQDEYILNAQDLIVTMTDLSKAGDTLGYPAFVPDSDVLRYHHNQRIGLVVFEESAVGKFYLNSTFSHVRLPQRNSGEHVGFHGQAYISDQGLRVRLRFLWWRDRNHDRPRAGKI